MKISHQARQLCTVIYVVLHLAAHYSAHWFEVMPGISIWYAPCGLAMAVLLLLGPSYWPLVLGTNLVTAYFGNTLGNWWSPLLFPALITLNYSCFAWLFKRRLSGLLSLDSFGKTSFLILILFLAPATLALSGTGLLRLIPMGSASNFWSSSFLWWLGDFTGLLTVVPAAVVFGKPLLQHEAIGVERPFSGSKLTLYRLLQTFILVAALVLAFAYAPLRSYNAFYICFIPLVWICLTQGLPGASLATLLVTMGGLSGIHFFGDGSEVLIVNFSVFIVAVACVGLGLGSVVSSRNEMQQRMLRSQKMESLGILAGGIAHDFNNLLTVILGNASLAKLDTEGNEPAQSSLEQIESASRAASKLCEQMLVYAGKASLKISNFELHAMARSTIAMLGSNIPKQCRVILQPTTRVARVMADENQLRQILITLLINASEAFGAEEGRIIIRTDKRLFSKEETRSYLASTPLKEGAYSVLEIEDNGPGMPADVLQRIFEPFFTTKFIGKGMGLAAVLGMVKGNGGGIFVRSKENAGTCFRLIFPAASTPVSSPSPLGSVVPSPPLPGGLVLVVDDDTGVRTLVSRSLKSIGFESIEAADGLEAVELFTQHRDDLCCVITDIAMPRMDGVEAFIQMNRLDPSIPVVLMSAYDPRRSLEKLGGLKPASYLNKPFDHHGLEIELTRILGDTP